VKKTTKSLSGASQDAYFTRVLKTDPNLIAASRERIVRRLRDEVAQVRLRANAPGDIAASAHVALGTAAQPVEPISQPETPQRGRPSIPIRPT
jgi:hypothetical protein